MRTREEINSSPQGYEKLTLEVLLDIRDLLSRPPAGLEAAQGVALLPPEPAKSTKQKRIEALAKAREVKKLKRGK